MKRSGTKRLLDILLTLAMIVCMMPADIIIAADSGSSVDDLVPAEINGDISLFSVDHIDRESIVLEKGKTQKIFPEVGAEIASISEKLGSWNGGDTGFKIGSDEKGPYIDVNPYGTGIAIQGFDITLKNSETIYYELTVKEPLIKYSASITQSDFSSDCMEIPKLYWRMLRDFRAR